LRSRASPKHTLLSDGKEVKLIYLLYEFTEYRYASLNDGDTF